MPAVALPPTPPVLLHVTHQHADWIFSHLAPRGRIVALSKPHLDLTDLIAAAVKKAGPCRMTVCVWEVGQDAVEKLVELHRRGAFLSSRFIVPPAQTEDDERHYTRFREIFGPDAIIEAACHAKVAILENDRWSIAVRGSLNMYSCGDVESFDIDDSPEICALVNEYAEDPETVSAYPKPKEARERADRLVAAHVQPGCRFFGLTAGYDLPAIVDALLARTGPATVTIGTAYMAAASSALIAAMPGSRPLFGRAAVTLDHKGSTAKAALAAFGPERIRIAMTHAKIITIRNTGWNLTIRGSANMCRNLRVENFDISDDPAVANQADAFVDYMFAATPEGLRVPQTIISRALRGALNDTETPEPTTSGPLKLTWSVPRPVSAGVLPEAKRLPSSVLLLPRVVTLPRLVNLLLPLGAAPALLAPAASSTLAPASERPRHDSTSSPQPTTPRPALTLPRRGAALQLPLALPRALPPPAEKEP